MKMIKTPPLSGILLFLAITLPVITFAETPVANPTTEIKVPTTDAPIEDNAVTLEQAQQAAQQQTDAENQANEADAAYKKLANISDDETAIEAAKVEAESKKELAEQLANQASEVYENLSDTDKATFDKAVKEAEKKAELQAKTAALSEILESIDAVKKEIIAKKNEQKAALIEEEKERIASELKRLSNRISALKTDFSVLATSIDPKNFFEEKEEKISWEEELQQIFSPFIIKLKEASERPRKIEALKSQLLYYELRIPDIQRAIATIASNQKNATDKTVKAELKHLNEFWLQQEKEFETKQASAKQQLHDLENRKESLGENAEGFLASLKLRATNIGLALLAFGVLLFVFRFLNRTLQKVNPLQKSPKYLTLANLTHLLLHAIGIIISATAGFFVLYSSGDWLLIGFALLVVIALVWGLRNAVLGFWEQTRLILNIGAVRKGERVIYEGLPYRVDSIGVFCTLTNPALTGGTLRLPIKDLIGMRSRVSTDEESWFPCKEGDFVLMDGKTWRQIAQQTPQRVKFDSFGMEETIPTATFLKSNIRNLSKTEFWVGGTIYISYDHRHVVMDEIVNQLGEFLEEEFKKSPLGEFLVAPWVDFSEMTETSLGVMAWVKVTPEAAGKYNGIKMTVNKICLRAANKFGWEVKRFHQLEQRSDSLEDDKN